MAMNPANNTTTLTGNNNNQHKSLFNGMAGSLISPSSECCDQPKKSLGLILKAALAEQDTSEERGESREFMLSEDFGRLDKSVHVEQDKENFSQSLATTLFSPIHGSGKCAAIVMDQKTELAHAQHHFELSEFEESEESEITEDHGYVARSRSSSQENEKSRSKPKYSSRTLLLQNQLRVEKDDEEENDYAAKSKGEVG